MTKFLYFLIVCIFLSSNILADDIDEADLALMKDYNFLVRSRNNVELKKKIMAVKEPAYAESYLMAMILQNEKQYKDSILWYARAAFKYKDFPPGGSLSTIVEYMESGIRRSPLYYDCVFSLAQIFFITQSAESASTVLQMLPGDIDDILKKRSLELRVEIIGRLNAPMAIEVYRRILVDYQSPVLYLKLGGLELATGKTEEAFDDYFYVLNFPDNTWAYIKSVHQIEYLSKNSPSLLTKVDDFKKTQWAEGLRLEKKFPQSLAMWKSIDPQRLSGKGIFTFLQNYCRLDINIRQFSHCTQLVNQHAGKLDVSQRDALYTDLGDRYYSNGQFFLLTQMIPQTELRYPSLIRLRALDKIKSPDRMETAKQYLNKFDRDSQYAEGVFFGACFEFLEKSNTDSAIKCLLELRDATVNVSVGGRSRYFLARLYEKNGQLEKSREMYKEVYVNSPEHFYAFSALRKINVLSTPSSLMPEGGVGAFNKGIENQPLMRDWIAENFNKKSVMEEYFQEKNKRHDFGVDKFWITFEKKLHETVNSMTPVEKKASLFSAMGYDNLAEDYLNFDTNSERKYMILLNSGVIANDAYLKFTYMKLLMSFYGKQVDIMTLSSFAAHCLFPTPFRDEVSAASKKYGIEEASVYALMKQESAFHPGATSPSGARGLMQLMPATAKWLNKGLKLKNMNLYDPGQSIILGSFFYSWLNKVSDGSFEKMAIAYNAGPGRLHQWENRYEGGDPEYFFEKIPTDETYAYVQITRKYYDRYKILLGYDFPNQPF